MKHFSYLIALALLQTGCVSTAVGVTGAAVKGTAKAGTAVVKGTAKAGGAVAGAAVPDKDEDDPAND